MTPIDDLSVSLLRLRQASLDPNVPVRQSDLAAVLAYVRLLHEAEAREGDQTR